MRLTTIVSVVIVALFVVPAVLVSAGCGGFHSDVFGTYQVDTKHYKIDGKQYRCFLIRTHKGTASLTCDWDHPLP